MNEPKYIEEDEIILMPGHLPFWYVRKWNIKDKDMDSPKTHRYTNDGKLTAVVRFDLKEEQNV